MRVLQGVWLGALLLAGCDRAAVVQTSVVDAAVVQTSAASIELDAGFVSAASELAAPLVDPGGARPLAAVCSAGEKVDVPAGSFASGSAPGDEGRDPGVEPSMVPMKMGAFAIDALPFPNDPAAAPELASSAAEARRACEGRGARLCSELEWERSCKGPEGDRYATGRTWNETCDRAPSRCASGFGARGMGFMREWTDSVFGDLESGKSAVVRGGPAGARRCAARSRASAKGMPVAMAFRCCHGDRNEVAIAPIEAQTAFRKTSLEAAELATIFAKVPELARMSDGIRLFNDPDVKSILARSSASADGITFTTAPILWSPSPGVELLIVAGRAKRNGFVVALWPLAAGAYRFASSFLLLNDAAPIALAYEPGRRKELRWTTCWSCAGEQGAVSLRDDGRVVIVQY